MNNTVSKTFRHASNVISISDIVTPWTRTKKGDNDKNNKIRELIVCATVNKAVPEIFYTDEEYGSRWKTMRSSINTFLNEIGADPDNSTMELKGGRKFNFDFILTTNGEEKKIELKFGSTTVNGCPQFVSPTQPSRFMTKNFERYWHGEGPLDAISERAGLTKPDLETYTNEVSGNAPPCMKEYQTMYKTDKAFSEFCKKTNTEAIKKFMNQTQLRADILTNYLVQSQRGKIYMLYSPDTESFHVEYANLNDYVIIRQTHQTHNSFYCETLTGKKLKVLLRWKNGNGIAFPAFQIS